MKFYSGKISTAKSAGFGEFMKKIAAANAEQNLTKTASSTAPAVKEANLANLGDKAAKPFGSKDKSDTCEDKSTAKSDDKKEDKKECDSSASVEKEVKVAAEGKTDKDGIMHVKKQEMDPVGGANTGKPEGEKKKKEASVAKKADNTEVPEANKGVTHTPDECCGAPTSGDGSEGSKKSEKKEEKSEKKEAKSVRFVRIANLDSKTKNEWKTYWKNLYPTDYVDAMFADK